MRALSVFGSLRNPVFAQLYAAQTISLLGDAFTWVALALLAFELAGEKSGVVLGTALTLRVTAFVLFSSLGGVLADRVNRKALMVGADLARVVIIGLIPLTTEVWQVYGLMFLLNAFTAVFTPTFQATVPLVAKQDYPQAIALSSATNELLGVLGPGLAGGLAALLGGRSLFWLDGATFALSALLILALRTNLQVKTDLASEVFRWSDLREGTRRLWVDPRLRYALLLELVAAISGAWVLVNTVGYVKGNLGLGDGQYGWVMAAFGVGATLAALAAGALDKRLARTTFVLLGATLTTLAILPTAMASLVPLMLLWFLAGVGQNWVNLPTNTLIADHTPEALQGRVYGAHFAWSHLWWMFSYPLAGWLGNALGSGSFLLGGLLGLGLLAVVQVLASPKRQGDIAGQVK
ncbi:MFS transporter [Meiothermus granaticius]|uniref:Multidrug resistance protein MdtG n=1 Tax=Meiothermus granaticius NBRC 107808 TaxID=1227551 RepID=A0A399FBB1_9DEIN|nr:MFS transporter [Meiothermus granaticius]MCL6526405.1 MFS transporter [Thermaceae bacterium]RIH93498.1 Multidrug resistance protein MdtG [Meiothermus granaticius NBRC 107808]GEM85993.1 MFS transporter [Meiothermus granaticius NBRC 107808]